MLGYLNLEEKKETEILYNRKKKMVKTRNQPSEK